MSSTRRIFSQMLTFTRGKSTLAFKHDKSKHALIFYSRDPRPDHEPLVLDPDFTDRYLETTGKAELPMLKRGNSLVPDCRKMMSPAVASVLEELGQMPSRREFTVCAISKLFFLHKAFRVGFPGHGPGSVRLKPGFLLSRLLEEEFELEGKVDAEAYRRLKRTVVHNCYVRHGIEVRRLRETGEERCVVFPRRISRREIVRCLSMSGIRMRRMRLRIFRPRHAKMIPT